MFTLLPRLDLERRIAFMLSSLLRPRKGRRRIDKSPSSPYSTSPGAVRNRNRNDDHDNEHDSDEDEEQDEYNGADMGYHEEDEEEDDDEENTPLLPIFSAAILGMSCHRLRC